MDSVWVVIFIAVISGSGGVLITTIINHIYEIKRQHNYMIFKARLDTYSKFNYNPTKLKKNGKLYLSGELFERLQKIILIGSAKTSDNAILLKDLLVKKPSINSYKDMEIVAETINALVGNMRTDLSQPKINLKHW